ncbi:MAG: AAA family ATPase [Candidatus Thiodiazotropha sp.]
MSRHEKRTISYLNGGGASGKTTQAIQLFRQREPLIFAPTHRLAKEMRERGVWAQTYHSFFRWNGQTKRTADRMGNKFVPHVIIWDKVMTAPKPILETFLDWLDGRVIQIVCCGYQRQLLPIAGEMLPDWLQQKCLSKNNFYEEVEVDHRAKNPALKALKKRIGLQTDKVQCREVRKVLPGCLG